MSTRPQEKKKYTIDDYMKTPDYIRYELIDGELLMTPSPKTSHQRILGRLYIRISQFVSAKDAGEVFLSPCDVVFDNENIFEPDILYISKGRLDIITEANIKGAPDLIVEILSPSTTDRDAVKKKRLYAKFGVQEYWIVDPEVKTVEIYSLEGDKFILKAKYSSGGVIESVLIEGLRILLEEIFST